MAAPLEILLIEDDEVDRIAVKRALNSQGIAYNLTSCANATKSNEAVQHKHFDIILLDYRLPDATGIEVLNQMRQWVGTTPVIIITSQGDEKLAAEAIKAGAADYIPKSALSPETLMRSMDSALRIAKIEREKEAAERALQKSQSQLQAVISSSPIILFSINQEGVFTLCEGAGLELLNLKQEDVIGRHMNKFFRDQPEVLAIIKDALNGQAAEEVTEFGGLFFNTFYQPVYNEMGSVVRVTGISTDITQRMHAEQALVAAKELAEDTAQLKQDFLANMSHEIRTPMNAIVGFTNLLSETDLEATQQEYVEAIQTSGRNLLVLINDILDFSRIEAGKLPIELVPFDLSKLLRDLELTYSVKAREKGLDYRVLCDDLPPMLVGDPVRINQVLVNLIGNAIKFTESGGIELRVTCIENRESEVQCRFTVFDTGIGIAQDKLDNIFESFTQVTGNYNRQFGGTGLGLAIAKELTILMGGKLTVTSDPGAGSQFSIILPLTIAPAAMPEVQPEAANAETSLEGLNILLAEDNVLNQKLACRVLEQLNGKVTIAANGKIALELLTQQPFDIVLMDVQMPEMDGLTATQKIRKEQLNAIPILAVTAHALKEEIQKCLDAGMNDYVLKPFNKEELVQKILGLTRHAIN